MMFEYIIAGVQPRYIYKDNEIDEAIDTLWYYRRNNPSKDFLLYWRIGKYGKWVKMKGELVENEEIYRKSRRKA